MCLCKGWSEAVCLGAWCAHPFPQSLRASPCESLKYPCRRGTCEQWWAQALNWPGVDPWVSVCTRRGSPDWQLPFCAAACGGLVLPGKATEAEAFPEESEIPSHPARSGAARGRSPCALLAVFQMKISFNESSLQTMFEYPSESSLVEEEEEEYATEVDEAPGSLALHPDATNSGKPCGVDVMQGTPGAPAPPTTVLWLVEALRKRPGEGRGHGCCQGSLPVQGRSFCPIRSQQECLSIG